MISLLYVYVIFISSEDTYTAACFLLKEYDYYHSPNFTERSLYNLKLELDYEKLYLIK